MSTHFKLDEQDWFSSCQLCATLSRWGKVCGSKQVSLSPWIQWSNLSQAGLDSDQTTTSMSSQQLPWLLQGQYKKH
ncbi:hypothetical protein ScPMuIL_016752 [Solemya velum]